MLEECLGMEKKPNVRTSAVPTKSGTEVKKNSDSFGRFNRRREPSSNSNVKNEPVRKPNQQARGGKYADKRPRSRGQYFGGGKSETKVDLGDFGPEYGSVFVPGSKKQNLNHLLNFTLTPRATVLSSSGGNGQSRERNGHWLFATHKHKYNKEEFLQANCQFVVKSNVDYCPYLVDPDILVEWDYIEQVRLRSTEHLSCPICLDTPRAAKMTRCGHVYCWPCILHYLALSDKSWRKCPICYESVHRKDLKSVSVVENNPARVGEEVTFYLMKRERDSILCTPVGEDEIVQRTKLPFSINDQLQSLAFSKLLTASHMDVEKLLKEEREELEIAKREAFGEPEVCFIEEALEILKEREDGGNKVAATSPSETLRLEKLSVSSEEDTPCLESNQEVVSEEVKSCESSGGDLEESLPNVSPDDVETENQVIGVKPFYFYQAADGQNMFLTALNLRMLETQFGSLQQGPLVITGKVLEKETGSMTRELRNRLRSLSHLPITGAFELLELDMSAVVSRDVMEAFAEPLAARAERRNRRARQERRREKKISHETSLQWGQQQPAPRIRLDSARHFPRCGEDDQSLLVAPSPPGSSVGSRSQSLTSLASTGLEPEPPLLTSSPSLDGAGPSFAQMLKTSGSTSMRRSQPAWGKAATSLPPPGVAEVIDDDLDGYSYVPHFQHSFSEAISQALERADLKLDEPEINSKKKKKKKPKVLFASGMAFTAK